MSYLMFVLVLGLLFAVGYIALSIVSLFLDWRDRRRACAEAELDRQQAQLRASILALAANLNLDAHEARKALIRESFLASGVLPPRD